MTMIALAALALLSVTPASAALERSNLALAEADFEVALTLAEQAEAEAEDAATLALVYRQQGVVREILGRADQAVIAFARALRCDGSLTLDALTSKKTTLELFALARALDGARTDIVRVRKNLDARAGRDTELCARPGEGSPLTATPPPAAGVGWPVWALAGTAVAGAGAAGVLGSLALSKNAECRSVAAPLYAQCDDQATTLETGANIAWTSAGVSAAAAIMVWWLSSD
jgi:tetratricopeptide (TPR) repeat protein